MQVEKPFLSSVISLVITAVESVLSTACAPHNKALLCVTSLGGVLVAMLLKWFQSHDTVSKEYKSALLIDHVIPG